MPMPDALKPRPYDLDKPDEVLRLYRECRGYLRACHGKHGMDWEGRKFAMEALDALVEKTTLLRALKRQQTAHCGSS